MELFLQTDTYVAIFSISLLLIALNVDNVVFDAILASRLPENQRYKAMNYSIAGTIVISIVLAMGIGYLSKIKKVIFTVFGEDITIKDLTLIVGGLFLLVKSVMEIHDKLEGEDELADLDKKKKSFWQIVMQMYMLNFIFSIDSVLTAVGMTPHLQIAVVSLVLSILTVAAFARKISKVVIAHPTLKVLALSFMLLIGILLVTEGFHHPIPKGYIYFSMIFSIVVEIINIRVRKVSKPVPLHKMPKPEDLDCLKKKKQ